MRTEKQIAELVVEAIENDITNRRVLKHEWDNIDDDIQAEIRDD